MGCGSSMPLRPKSAFFLDLNSSGDEVDLSDQLPTARATRLPQSGGVAALAPRDTKPRRNTSAPRQPPPAMLSSSQSAQSLAIAAARAAAPHPLAHLTTTPTSRIPQSAKERIGVAIWMKPLGEASLDDRDRRYGAEFHAASSRLGAEIARGQLASFDDLWTTCRAWRVQQFDKALIANELRHLDTVAGSGQDLYETRMQFSTTRQADGSESCTPIVGPYIYLHPRIMAASGRDFIAQSGERTRAMRQTLNIDGAEITLTKLAAFTNDKGEKALARTPKLPNASVFGVVGHTDADQLPPLKSRIEKLFRQVLAPNTTDPEQRLDLLAEMHWLLAHAMPDHRGSAAKSELAIRALAMAMDMELPPFRHNIAPDLEAFVTTCEEFKLNYASEYFETEQTMTQRELLRLAELHAHQRFGPFLGSLFR